jgi:uncharacterized protein with GYD domain
VPGAIPRAADSDREFVMPYYLHRVTFTSRSMEALIKKPQDRTPVVRKLFAAHGGKLHHYFFAFGKYDVVIISEFPNNESAAAALMTAFGAGALSGGETTVLMTVDEAVKAMKQAGSAKSKYSAPKA